ncbi:methyltransferase domain-containing protein [Paenibacillus sp. SC116]|uniref:putative RNA methyltransferase n=1 Tax=Paenibacillus sp. SC116 TaxID=2968986 RepID=UPI00215A1F36|nr:methyltransferase domain-containing protein [Paenibacillus sp. SC116]MCR8846398.1 methyltransferase domain-containing protein [Paenibacillus sp. SC116]
MCKNKIKIDDGVRLITNYQHVFTCPICSQVMEVHSRSLVFRNRHSFDIAKHGYVNLLSRAHNTKYDKELFAARKKISADGFFEPLIEQLYRMIVYAYTDVYRDADRTTHGMIKILDAGCGEGSHLSDIQRRLTEHTSYKHLGVGIDIAKEGISLASRNGAVLDTVWCVADIANCPFADRSFDIILNVLSPANYTEFQRLLTDDGLFIKVIPESNYLQQIRSVFYGQTDKDMYTNEQTLELFKRHFQLLDIQRVQYEASLNKEQIKQLIRMTPLSWGASEEAMRKLSRRKQMEITFDYSILIGRNK